MNLALSIKTDKPVAELGLFSDGKELDYLRWKANLRLAETIHIKINELLEKNGHQLHDLNQIIIFKGPGSFTGLRIGASVANTLAWALGIGIKGTSGEKWLDDAQSNNSGLSSGMVVPEYGAPAKTTTPKSLQ